MASLNEVKLIGNLGADIELREANGDDVCTITVATTERRGKGERAEEYPEWHRVVLWGHNARYANKYLRKGDLVLVSGRLRTRKWKDHEGADQYTTEIVADDFQGLNLRNRTRDNAGHEQPAA